MVKKCFMYNKRIIAAVLLYVIVISSVCMNGTGLWVMAEEETGEEKFFENFSKNISENISAAPAQEKEPAEQVMNAEAATAAAVTGSAITTKAKGLFITEIYRNSMPENSNTHELGEPLEFVELYNSTDENIRFNEEYTISSVSGSAIAWKKLTVAGISGSDVIIPQNSAALLWLSGTDAKDPVTAEKEANFRKNFNINPAVPVYSLTGQDSLNNTSGFQLENRNGIPVSSVHYTAGELGSIHLKVSGTGSTMTIYKQTAEPSPGVVEEEQLLYETNPIPDTNPPRLLCDDFIKQIQLGDSITVKMTSNEALQSAEVTYAASSNGVEGAAAKVSMVHTGEKDGIFTYEGTIKPEQTGVYVVRLKGKDLAGNETRLPADGSVFTVTVLIKDTGSRPILTCLDETINSIEEGQEMNIPYSYADDMEMKKINIYYKTSSAADYKCIETTSFRIAGKYFAKIPADELLNQDYVDYYLEGFNPYRSTKTVVKRIAIHKIDDFTGIRTNLSEGMSLSGNVLITAKDKKDKNTVSLEIDGTKIKRVSLLEKGAFFTYSYTGNDSYFKNAVSIGENILTYIAKWSNVMASKAVFVDQSFFTYREDGSCAITVSVWAGTQGSAFEIGNDKNNDDYKATGFHLVLTDGTVLNPDNGVDPNTVYKMGDSKGMIERLDIHYTVPAEKVDALGYVWDTTLEKDGIHEVTIKSATDTKKIKVRVDNTAPEITAALLINQQLDNLCQADMKFNDATGINENTLEVYLNGNILKEPYTFKGSDLLEGTNKLVIKIMDLNGNQGIQTIDFTYTNGKLVVKSMTQTGGSKDSIYLKAILGDTMKDHSKVTFYEGKRLKAGKEITIRQGSGDFTGSSVPGALGTVASGEGEYPYQIYDIQAAGNPNDILQVKLNASADYNKPLQLYVYNVKTDSWEILNANEEDGILKTEFILENHTQNGIVKVLVQARGKETTPSVKAAGPGTIKNTYQWDGQGIPEQYDFSFAWITDTQYYTETWPETFTTMNQWIVSQINNQKIKYAIHTGDLVDEFEQIYQWECVDKNMKYFEEAKLPYGVLAGNHDVAAGNELYENYLKYFGEKRFKDSPVYGGSYKNNLGHYDLLTINGEEFIVLYMGWDVYKNEVEWMNKVLQQYNDRKAIICLHRYITEKGALDYTGELVQKEVAAKNPNVFAVLNGHYHGAAINITAFDDNHDGVKERRVYQICTDYQSAERGGTGYVKMLYFDLANNKIYMNSYSSELKDFNYFDTPKLDSYQAGVIAANQDIYELDVDFNRKPRSLTVTSLEASLFTGKTIGVAESVNGVAEMEWKGLVKDKEYGWYTAVKNNSGLLTRSEVNEFVYLPSADPEPQKPEPSNPEPVTPSPSNNTSLVTGEAVKEIPDYKIPEGLTAVYGDSLAQIILPEGFAFEAPGNTSVGDAGLQTFKVTYTPKDTKKYKIVTGIEVQVAVEKAEAKFIAPGVSGYTKVDGGSSFSIKARTTGNGRITYRSDNPKVAAIDRNGTVAIKGPGKAVITLTAAETGNYKAITKTIPLVVKPKKVIIQKLEQKASDTLTLSWKRDPGATGYEIIYGLNKGFTKEKKVISVKSNKTTVMAFHTLKRGTAHYVKIRAYKTIDGNKLYGSYSTVRKISGAK